MSAGTTIPTSSRASGSGTIAGVAKPVTEHAALDRGTPPLLDASEFDYGSSPASSLPPSTPFGNHRPYNPRVVTGSRDSHRGHAPSASRDSNASDFSRDIPVEGEERFGYRIIKLHAPTIPNAIAAFLLYIRDTTGQLPHCYFSWTEGNPLVYVFRYLALGEGDIAPVTREVLREAESDPEKRPAIHVGGK